VPRRRLGCVSLFLSSFSSTVFLPTVLTVVGLKIKNFQQQLRIEYQHSEPSVVVLLGRRRRSSSRSPPFDLGGIKKENGRTDRVQSEPFCEGRAAVYGPSRVALSVSSRSLERDCSRGELQSQCPRPIRAGLAGGKCKRRVKSRRVIGLKTWCAFTTSQ
jgi:hypothetical protein